MAEIAPLKSIIINGKEHRLKNTMRAAKIFKEKTGKSLIHGFRLSDLTEEEFCILIWSQLLHENDPSITPETIMDVDLNDQDIPQLATQSIIDSLPDKKEGAIPNGENLPLS